MQRSAVLPQGEEEPIAPSNGRLSTNENTSDISSDDQETVQTTATSHQLSETYNPKVSAFSGPTRRMGSLCFEGTLEDLGDKTRGLFVILADPIDEDPSSKSCCFHYFGHVLTPKQTALEPSQMTEACPFKITLNSANGENWSTGVLDYPCISLPSCNTGLPKGDHCAHFVVYKDGKLLPFTPCTITLESKEDGSVQHIDTGTGIYRSYIPQMDLRDYRKPYDDTGNKTPDHPEYGRSSVPEFLRG